MISSKNLFKYKISKVIKIVDGDTIDVLVDLGFNIHIKTRVRLSGINAPESRTRNLAEKKRGLASKAKLEELCEGDLILESHGIGKYGRVLGEIWKHGTSINNMMITEGYAQKYE